MEFCPKCGAILVEKDGKSACTRCSYSSKEKCKLKTCEKIEETKEIALVNESKSSNHPIVDEKCKKCNHPQAYFWTMQTRSSDEAETKFFKCTKCAHTWRSYR